MPRERLQIDWTRCQARGACMELLPELLIPDDWGYPLAAASNSTLEVSIELHAHAQRAVKECPRLALAIVTD